MAIKTFLILLSLISSPSVSGAEYLHLQKYSLMQGRYQIAQDTDELFGPSKPTVYPSPETQTSIKPTKPLKPVSPGWALLMASIPLTSSLLICGIEAIKTSGFDDPYERQFLIFPTYAFFASILLPIPAHIYVHDSFLKNSLIFTGKAISIFVLFDFAVSYGRCNNCENGCSGCDQYQNKMGMILGLSGLLGMNVYELIDAPLAAKRYNRKIQQQQGLYILPYAYKDQYRVNVGYRF